MASARAPLSGLASKARAHASGESSHGAFRINPMSHAPLGATTSRASIGATTGASAVAGFAGAPTLGAEVAGAGATLAIVVAAAGDTVAATGDCRAGVAACARACDRRATRGPM